MAAIPQAATPPPCSSSDNEKEGPLSPQTESTYNHRIMRAQEQINAIQRQLKEIERDLKSMHTSNGVLQLSQHIIDMKNRDAIYQNKDMEHELRKRRNTQFGDKWIQQMHF